eukprot:CAMPEP_0194372444 /NCGR_PEP_ID=MMETSP0174-20130528/20810_1 /TAXON_ID=216777 /ORGANISM="Proboscia alata, Strain PI-D3" /LENGTH=365 /DNA_ID=CAMNT_0039150985 /DNA_START=156 /DNA_END=1253 /DNA_ORIENTATION=-
MIIGMAAAESIPTKPSLSFMSGGVQLDPPQPMIPPGLDIYHTISLDLTEEAYIDPEIAVTRAIPYGNFTHQKLDVWTPLVSSESKENRKTLLPVVIAIHGGGWEVGYREYVGFMARHLCSSSNQNFQNQVIMVSPTYKLGLYRDQMWPQSRDDIIEAIRWVTKNAQEHGGDPNCIILTGHSAGGHLAAAVGLDPDLLLSRGIEPRCIKALFLVSCPLGVQIRDWFVPKNFFDRIKEPFVRFFDRSFRKRMIPMLRPVVGIDEGDNMQAIIATLKEASPLATLKRMNHKTKQKLPYVHYTYASEGDFGTCGIHARRLKRLLPKGRSEVMVLPVTGHLESHFCMQDSKCEWYAALARVLDEYAPPPK